MRIGWLAVGAVLLLCAAFCCTQLAEVDRPTFLGRMRAAFQLLEAAVGEGRIRWYGTATWNGYRQPASARDFPSFTRTK